MLKKLVKIYSTEGLPGITRRIRYRLSIYFPKLANGPWIKRYTPTVHQLADMKDAQEDFGEKPLISVIMPVYNPNLKFLREAVESVQAQIYSNWELCIADDASTDPEVKRYLQSVEGVGNIKIALREDNGHIAVASNTAMDLATGTFVALLDHDDLLAPHALHEIAKAIDENPDVDMLYSNEDKVDSKGNRTEPTLKGEWSPEFLGSFMYIGHLTVYRRSLVEKLGGFREGYEGSQDYDLALRASETTKQIKHIPEILYHWRRHKESVASKSDVKDYALRNARKALRDSLTRRGLRGARIQDGVVAGIYHPFVVSSALPEVLCLSWADSKDDAVKRVAQVRDLTSYGGVEFMVIAPEGEVVKFGSDGKLTTLSLECNSWSDFIAQVVAKTRSPYIALLGGGLVPARSDWLDQLLTYAGQEDIAIAGSKIIRPDGRYIHAGYTVMEGVVSNNFFDYPKLHPGYGGRLYAAQNVSAVSCFGALVSKVALLESGVLEESYQSSVAFDVDLCFSLADKGRVVWTPQSEFTLEGAVPEPATDLKEFPADLARLSEKHKIGNYIDPFYPVGLNRAELNFKLAV